MIDATVYFLQRCIDEERQYKPILMNKEDIIVIPHSLKTETKYFSDEVEVLKKAYPELAKAMQEDLSYTLELTLQEISKLFLDRRVRLDAYKRLIRYLATEFYETDIEVLIMGIVQSRTFTSSSLVASPFMKCCNEITFSPIVY